MKSYLSLAVVFLISSLSSSSSEARRCLLEKEDICASIQGDKIIQSYTLSPSDSHTHRRTFDKDFMKDIKKKSSSKKYKMILGGKETQKAEITFKSCEDLKDFNSFFKNNSPKRRENLRKLSLTLEDDGLGKSEDVNKILRDTQRNLEKNRRKLPLAIQTGVKIKIITSEFPQQTHTPITMRPAQTCSSAYYGQRPTPYALTYQHHAY